MLTGVLNLTPVSGTTLGMVVQQINEIVCHRIADKAHLLHYLKEAEICGSHLTL